MLIFHNDLQFVTNKDLQSILYFVFFGHTLLLILLPSSRWSDILNRMFIVGNFSWKKHLDNRNRQLDFINHLDKSQTVYMWGSNIALLLLGNLRHVEGTYFSHNHLVLWSTIENKKDHALDIIKKHQPTYIIESNSMGDLHIPCEINDNYQHITTIDNMTIYKIKRKDIHV
jgi:hypothetical protein